ncbi:FtsX-like permease family protein [Kribbella sp. VKM Ac-2568]|uniref:FtsX-like permease family protein n=1 Tax=Kribbella sp. VKM Ac-2568 TaxID=2512219 RepID=UPI00104F0D7A|nr:FtsX-like permease family protein [Kribbella sp. VKM Ac-2568]TCM43448.1 FtsX-like permease family protein [Kribbella sp. VKM Ac-2568]
MFLRRALSYRRSQALVLAGVSLLIGTCATFAPWFSRAVEQTVTTETLSNQYLSASWQVEAKPPNSVGASTPKQPEDLTQLIPADLKPLFTPPAYGLSVDVLWGLRGRDREISTKVIWRDGYCAQLVIVQGRCPQAAGEVVASIVDEKSYDAKPGAVLDATSDNYAGGGSLKVVGLYRPVDQNAPYWFGRGPIGRSGPATAKTPATSDYLLTVRETFNTGVWGYRSTMDTRPIPGVATADHLERIKAVTNQVDGNAAEQELEAQNSTGLDGLIDTIQAERKQATTIIPLVMVQVALFGVVVLALALGAVVDQRRPEVAVARLRGSSARRTGRSLFIELGAAVLIGTLAGIVTGFGLLMIVRATWLNDGAPLEFPWTVPAALAVAAVVGLAVVAWSVRAVVRQPISTLLRRVAPRRRGRAIGMIDLSIIVLASAGLVAALTGGGRGPLPVLTPTLLALAVGLTFAHLLLPAAGLVSRQALGNGRVGLALGALQVSRRPAVTRIVAVVAVATALVSFAGQASSVAGHNREVRAGYETGADGILLMKFLDLGDFTRAIDKIDPDRHWFTPVVFGRPPSPDALRTLMIEPDSFQRIAFRGDQLTDAEGFQQLKAPTGLGPIDLRSDRLQVTATPGKMTPVLPRSASGEAPPPQPPAKSVIIEANVVSLRNGARYLVRFDPMPLVTGKTFILSTSIDCLGGCRLLRLGIGRDVNDSSGVRGEIAISKLGTPRQPSLALGKAADWKPIPQLGGDLGSLATKDGPAGGLTLDVTSLSAEQFVQYGTVPPTMPALVTPEYSVDESTSTPGVDGGAMLIQKIDRLRGPANRYSEKTAVVDLETVRRLGGSLDSGSTDFQLWLNADGLANLDKITKGLADAGVTASLVDKQSDRTDSYGRSASSLALQLTPVVGVAGWSLAIIVLLLMVVTSWRSRAQDYASLRLTGVPVGTTGRAARWEQTGPVALATLLGTACGIVGAQIALPLIPLFAETLQASPIPLELSTNWTVALVLWLIGTLVLTTTTLLLGTGVNRRAQYTRIREELS